jgi:hypothetical protein
LAFACGGDSGGGNGNNGGGSTTVNSGVDDSKPLSMLSDAEVQQLGESFGNASEGLADGMCKFFAKFGALGLSSDPNAAPTAAQVDACNDAYAECKAMPPSMAPASMFSTEVPTNAAAFAGCNVTVAQFEACLSATLTALTQVLGAVSCTSSGVPDTAAFDTEPAACAEYSAQCAGTLGT